MIRTISINFRPDDTRCTAHLGQLVEFLENAGIRVLLPRHDIILGEECYRLAVDEDRFVNDADLIIVIGGDGTFLRTARLFCGTGKPIFGINRGRLGFLTEFSPDEYPRFLDQVLRGDYVTTERLVLEATLHRDDRTRRTLWRRFRSRLRNLLHGGLWSRLRVCLYFSFPVCGQGGNFRRR